MRWEAPGRAILDRKKHQIYHRLVIPLGQEEMIAISQKYHKKAQKRLKKIIKLLQKARLDVENMPLSDNDGIDMISAEIKALQRLSEDLKKYYYEKLPYVELKDIGEDKK